MKLTDKIYSLKVKSIFIELQPNKKNKRLVILVFEYLPFFPHAETTKLCP